jgi:hypothetical protein
MSFWRNGHKITLHKRDHSHHGYSKNTSITHYFGQSHRFGSEFDAGKERFRIVPEARTSDEQFFAYYDFLNPNQVRPMPLYPFEREKLVKLGLESDHPYQITEENFYQYLPVRTEADVHYEDHWGAKGLADRLVSLIPGSKPLDLELGPRHRYRSPRFVHGPRKRERFNYVGGWTSLHMYIYIKENEALLRRRLGESPAGPNSCDSLICFCHKRRGGDDSPVARCLLRRAFLRANNDYGYFSYSIERKGYRNYRYTCHHLRAKLCHLIIQLKKNPDFLYDPLSLALETFPNNFGSRILCNLSQNLDWSKLLSDLRFETLDLPLLKRLNSKTFQFPSETDLVGQFRRHRPVKVFPNPLNWTRLDCLTSELSVEQLKNIYPEIEGAKEGFCGREEFDRAAETECALCGDPLLESGRELVALWCAHVFHSDCLRDLWKETGERNCPIDQSVFTLSH